MQKYILVKLSSLIKERIRLQVIIWNLRTLSVTTKKIK